MREETFITSFDSTDGHYFERWAYKRPETCLRKQQELFQNSLYMAATGRVIGPVKVQKMGADGRYVTVLEG